MFILIDETVHRVNQRITHYLRENDLAMAFVLRRPKKEVKEALKPWGKVPLKLASKLPEPPKIKRRKAAKTDPSERTFQRIKLLDQYGTLRSPVSPEEYEGHVFAFMNCGDVHNPDHERYPDMSMSKVIRYHHMLSVFCNAPIAFINVKRNEFDKLDQFSEFPLFYDYIDQIGAEFSPKHLRMIINTWNWDQFSYTIYHDVLNNWGNNVDGELAALRRFWRRNDKVPSAARKAVQAVLDDKKLTEAAISQALAAGLEVLPAKGYNRSTLPYPLLPPNWERFVRMLKNVRPTWNSDKQVYTHLKRSFEC